MRILLHRRHSGSIRNFERQPGHGDHGFPGLRDSLSIRGKSLRQMHEPFFEFTAKNGGYAERAKIINVHRSVQAVTAQMRAGILLPKPRNELCREPRGGVHGQIDRYELGVANRGHIQRLPG